jgi:secreted trypsin-like serine protease
LKIFDFKTCQKNYRKVKKHLNPKRHICADGGGTADTCQGDSGGPLVCLDANEGEVSKRAHLTGVVSFGAGCAEAKYPGVYVPISNYYKWIEQTVARNPNDPFVEGGTPTCPADDLECK